MRISEVIDKLSKIQEITGDVHVVVQYRDEDAVFNGQDGILEFKVEEECISDYELYLDDFKSLGIHERVLVL